MPRAALIAGASGLVGGYCLRELLREEEFDAVVAMVRKPLTLEHAKLSQIGLDAEAPPMPGGAVFCALGTTIGKAGSQDAFRKVDYDAPLRIAQSAFRAGASSFALVSSVGADANSSNFYLRVKGELENSIGTLGFQSLHIFQPSVLMGDRQERRPAERIGIVVMRTLQFAMVGALDRYRPIRAADVGVAMVRAAVRGDTGKHVYRWREIMSR